MLLLRLEECNGTVTVKCGGIPRRDGMQICSLGEIKCSVQNTSKAARALSNNPIQSIEKTVVAIQPRLAALCLASLLYALDGLQ